MKKVDKKSCLFILVFFLVFGGIVAELYLTAGLVDIPSASPLADPDYVIRTLPDVSLPYDAVIPPDTVTPFNQLYGGKNWVLEIVIWTAVIIVTSIIAIHRDEDSVFVRLGGWTSVMLLALGDIAKILAKIPFYYSHLRSSAQSIIDYNHRWRVILAYIGLWSTEKDTYAYAVVGLVFLIVFSISLAFASLATYIYWKAQSTTEDAKNRPF